VHKAFRVYGVPRPQGSVRAFRNIVVQGGSKESRDAQASWRTLIIDQARRHFPRPIEEGRISINYIFYLPKPKYAKKDAEPTKKPDLDKLIRAAGDALSTIAYRDDAQITFISAIKRYADANQTPGMDIRIRWDTDE